MDIQARLRHEAGTLRTKSAALSSLIPLLQQAADALDRAEKGGVQASPAALAAAIKEELAKPEQKPIAVVPCWCEACDVAANGHRSRMSTCPECGDKRCPRAKHHDAKCTKPVPASGEDLAIYQNISAGYFNSLRPAHTEADVQRILSCVTQVIGPDGQIFADLTATVRDVLGVPAPKENQNG
jgi:hypothetical protein